MSFTLKHQIVFLNRIPKLWHVSQLFSVIVYITVLAFSNFIMEVGSPDSWLKPAAFHLLLWRCNASGQTPGRIRGFVDKSTKGVYQWVRILGLHSACHQCSGYSGHERPGWPGLTQPAAQQGWFFRSEPSRVSGSLSVTFVALPFALFWFLRLIQGNTEQRCPFLCYN